MIGLSGFAGGAADQRALVREAPYSMLDYDSSCQLVDIRVWDKGNQSRLLCKKEFAQ
jgi:hypothetical protein